MATLLGELNGEGGRVEGGVRECRVRDSRRYRRRHLFGRTATTENRNRCRHRWCICRPIVPSSPRAPGCTAFLFFFRVGRTRRIGGGQDEAAQLAAHPPAARMAPSAPRHRRLGMHMQPARLCERHMRSTRGARGVPTCRVAESGTLSRGLAASLCLTAPSSPLNELSTTIITALELHQRYSNLS